MEESEILLLIVGVRASLQTGSVCVGEAVCQGRTDQGRLPDFLHVPEPLDLVMAFVADVTAGNSVAQSVPKDRGLLANSSEVLVLR